VVYHDETASFQSGSSREVCNRLGNIKDHFPAVSYLLRGRDTVYLCAEPRYRYESISFPNCEDREGPWEKPRLVQLGPNNPDLKVRILHGNEDYPLNNTIEMKRIEHFVQRCRFRMYNPGYNHMHLPP
jgi:hypothetical protein